MSSSVPHSAVWSSPPLRLVPAGRRPLLPPRRAVARAPLPGAVPLTRLPAGGRCRPSGSAGQTHEGIGGQGPGGLVDPGPPGIGGQELPLRFHRPEQACPGIGGELGVEPNGPVVVDPVAEVAGTMDGPVGRALVPPGGLGPTATQLEHVERLLDGCLEELPFGLGQEAGRAGDLLDLHFGEPPLADRLFRSREADELTGGLQGVDGGADPGSADLGDMGGRRRGRCARRSRTRRVGRSEAFRRRPTSRDR